VTKSCALFATVHSVWNVEVGECCLQERRLINDLWYKNAIVYCLSVATIRMRTAMGSETLKV